MTRRALLAMVAVLALSPTGVRAQQHVIEHYVLDVNGVARRSAAGVASYSLSGPGIVDVGVDSSVTPPSFTFLARRPGRTIVLLVLEDGAGTVACDVTIRAPR